jgi:hypothetical protein
VLAQDTGGAIKGAVRADFFWGFGAEAGARPGACASKGEMWALLPRPAFPTTPGSSAPDFRAPVRCAGGIVRTNNGAP